ncbi:zinc metalloprotease [Arachidicoccus terrestris]|uniref:hypothetical protein n=1 Tax=Arachidicoccus terrestris TaxID=2875539 RepID=UPI001CC37DFC|nr:hypothetical protein [Arachidicoccus terrestris]UAY55413.1 hypothetical protein K9M52_18735 [Arachidicoccus terrestris]
MHYKNHAILVFLAVLLVCCSKSDQPKDGSFNGKTYSKQSVGKSARDLLSAAPFTSLKIELQYTPDYKPDDGVISAVKNFLKTRLNKPGGVSITETQIPSLEKNQVSTDEVISVEDRYRTQYAGDQEITLYVVIADADYTDNSVLGFTYRNTSICLFGKTIYDNSGGIGQANRAQLFTTVLEHEIGHLLGLVDIGSSMQVNHVDEAHPDHCNNKNCLMYYAAETTDILGFLIAGNTPVLDQNCLNDLKANGGK